jgi:ATP-binding cassette subfamily F protein uup
MQKLMIKLTDLTKYYGDKKVFEQLNFELRGKEKIWLYGPNGAGKSTLVKMVMGFETPTSGEITIGNNVTIGYFSQTQHSFNQDSTLLNEFCTVTGTFFGDAFGYLKKFLFEKEDLQKRIFQLSPGERARFAFSIFAKKNYDLLILDEPDNHLDIETKEVIEKALREFNGAVLLISHDRYFVEMVRVNKVVNLKDGTLSYFEEE